MIKFNSIEQFRTVIKEVRSHWDFIGKDENGDPIYEHTSPYPILKFKGTIKLHGTNGGIVKYKDRIDFQSREKVLSKEQDNYGFYSKYSEKDLDFLFKKYNFENYVAIHGEWCGGSIQKNIALNKLDKMFVVFSVQVDGVKLDNFTIPNNNLNIYSIYDFKTYEIDIDFNNPENSQELLNEYTMEVENECPVALHFGVKGIGEGIVFKYKDYLFKSKGLKHSSSKVKVLNSVNVEEINKVKDFVELACSENRLNQGISYLKEMNIEISNKSTSDYLRWVINDILKEEMDTIIENNLDVNSVKKECSNKARKFYLNNIN